MTFVPLLGCRAEGQSMRWHTLSVRIGDRELVDAEADATRSGRAVGKFRFEYDLGGVVEAYEIRSDGLEQTFVIATRPPAAGDLVVTGIVGGTVSPQPRAPQHAALSLGAPGCPAVIGYGAATAVDATGRRVPMTTASCDGRIELRLAAAAVEQASFPLVVDPLLSNLVVGAASGVGSVDVFRDHQESQDQLWVTWSLAASATDQDVVVQRMPDDYSSQGTTVFADLSSSWDSFEPRISGSGGFGTGSTVAVFVRQFSATTRRVRYHVHDKASYQLTTDFGSVPFSGAEQGRPDIGGTYAISFSGRVLIVYQREPGIGVVDSPNSEIYALFLDPNSSQTTGPFLVSSVVGNVDAERPSINRLSDGGNSHSWVVAWQQFDNAANGPWQVRARRYAGGSNVDGETVVVAAGGEHCVAPVVGGFFSHYVIAYGTRPAMADKPQSGDARMIHSRRLEWGDQVLMPTVPYQLQTLHSAPAPTLQAGGAAFDYSGRSHFAVTCRDRAPGAERLLVDKLGYEGARSESHVAHDVTGWSTTRGAVTFDYPAARFLMMFAVDNQTAANPLIGTVLTHGQAAPPSQYGSQCGTFASLAHEGTQLIGSNQERFGVQTPIPQTPALFAASLGSASLPLGFAGMTGCELAIDPGPLLLGTVLHVTDANGHASQSLPIPSTMPPFDLFVQWFVVVAGANPAGIAASRGLQVPYVR